MTLRYRNRTYVVLFLLVLLVAFGMVMPRQLAQPILYHTEVAVYIDTQRYHEFFTAQGQLDAEFDSVRYQARVLMTHRYPSFGQVQMADEVVFMQDRLVVSITTNTPIEAVTLANEYADVLILTIQAAGGREILRNLLGWETSLALQGRVANDNEAKLLRDFVRLSAFTFNRPIEPVTEFSSVRNLSFADRSDLLRAVELQRLQLEQLIIPAANADKRAQYFEMVQSMRLFADVIIQQDANLAFDSRRVGQIYRLADAPLPVQPLSRNIGISMALTLFGALILTVIIVRFDQSVGIVSRLQDIWRYRILIEHMVRRNLLLRYRGSLLGFAWTQIAPLMQLMVYWVVFGYFFPGNALPLYPLFIAVALIPWGYTSDAIATSVRSIVDNAPLVRHAYFPREILPIASVLTSMVNFLLSMPVLLLFQVCVRYYAYESVQIPATILYFPIILLVHTIFVMGCALLLAAIAVYSLDIIHVVGIFLQIWFFLTPIVYSLNGISDTLARVIRWTNPMASIIEYYREILYGQPIPLGMLPTPGIPASESMVRTLLTALCVLGVGYWLFRRTHDYISEKL
ncbi:MAG: ABC transporter permease [Roseiflexaceae bacterium]